MRCQWNSENFTLLTDIHIVFRLVRVYFCLYTHFCRVIYIGSYKTKSFCMLFGNELLNALYIISAVFSFTISGKFRMQRS